MLRASASASSSSSSSSSSSTANIHAMSGWSLSAAADDEHLLPWTFVNIMGQHPTKHCHCPPPPLLLKSVGVPRFLAQQVAPALLYCYACSRSTVEHTLFHIHQGLSHGLYRSGDLWVNSEVNDSWYCAMHFHSEQASMVSSMCVACLLRAAWLLSCVHAFAVAAAMGSARHAACT
ncbi:hypothetical protein JKP88DRAFT_23531 [Tribonema minus]|uniref:Uncharacterized protein n=1 Tax=Tribonema minus TaxID=303371 RepID=A0A836CKU7_9STRA|nr:hypothetical protein JKP88DRAFT_23531 [Tribonema minus]